MTIVPHVTDLPQRYIPTDRLEIVVRIGGNRVKMAAEIKVVVVNGLDRDARERTVFQCVRPNQSDNGRSSLSNRRIMFCRSVGMSVGFHRTRFMRVRLALVLILL